MALPQQRSEVLPCNPACLVWRCRFKKKGGWGDIMSLFNRPGKIKYILEQKFFKQKSLIILKQISHGW